MSEHGNDVLGTGESPLDPARGDPECVEGPNGAPAAPRRGSGRPELVEGRDSNAGPPA
jgi:hypothetical protein